MTEHYKLSKLLYEAECLFYDTEAHKHICKEAYISDYLLKNGVIVPPCKVGDYVEWDTGLKLRLCRVNGFIYHTNDEIYPLRYELDDCQPIVTNNAIKRIVPREEAEKALNKPCGAVSLIDGHIDEFEKGQ